MKYRTLAEHFWALVDKNGPIPSHRPDLGPCWIWKGTRHHHGYARLQHRRQRKMAYRIAYELIRGPIPIGLQPDHLCFITYCVNPWHLEAVTKKVNILRGLNNPTAINARKTHCLRGHNFTEENTVRNKRGGRECRICKSAVRREWRRKRREEKRCEKLRYKALAAF